MICFDGMIPWLFLIVLPMILYCVVNAKKVIRIERGIFIGIKQTIKELRHG